MSEDPGPVIRVDKFGSTFEWTQERGWRVTPPSDLVLPPWDLCGFDRDFDPDALTEDDAVRFIWRSWNPLDPRGYAHSVERVPPDPNEADGRWRELAFTPHREATLCEGLVEFVAADYVVPEYLTVAEALRFERCPDEFLTVR